MVLKSEEKLDRVCMEIYRRMYKEAFPGPWKPSGDFDKMVEDGTAMQPGFYMNYHLSEDRQNAIIDEVCREFKLRKRDKDRVRFTVILGCSPISVE